ncbi:hypothetical protein MPSEU_000500700 [Mayamaea pseudoterrestris]|nr:hypothetical protein MPSEU_000500700 [Mayamaea pseudoterrestris]
MDGLLISASVALSYYIPVRGAFALQLLPVKSVLFLSFLLFSLSIIDATPSTWLLFLTHSSSADGDGYIKDESFNNYRSVAYAYYVVLWSIVFIILVVQPSIIGVKLCSQISPPAISNSLAHGNFLPDHEDKKKRLFSARTDYPFAIRVVVLAFRLLFRCIASLSWCLLGWLWTIIKKVLPRQRDVSILMMHHKYGGVLSLRAARLAWVRAKCVRLQVIIIGTLVGTGSTILVLHSMASPILSSNSSPDHTILAKAVSLVVALGIIISSILNGFGSVSMPYSCLAGLFLEPIRPEAITYAEKELDKAMVCLMNQRDRTDGVKLDVNSIADSPTRRQGFGDLGDEINERRKILADEAAFLESLVEEMKVDLAEMRNSQYMAAMSRTPLGALRSWLGLVFSLILALRLLSALMQILPQFGSEVNSQHSQIDIITKLLLWSQVSSQDAELLSQSISLILTLFLSFSQVRYFLRTAATVASWLKSIYQKLCCHCSDERLIANQQFQGFLSPVIGGCMGCYFLAANVLTKRMLPAQYSAGFSAALGDSHNAIRIRMDALNSIFVASAVVSGLILGMRLGIQRQNTRRHQGWINNVAAKELPLDP